NGSGLRQARATSALVSYRLTSPQLSPEPGNRQRRTATPRRWRCGVCPGGTDHWPAPAILYTVPVNAAPVLAEIAQALHRAGLEAVLIRNAAAALQGPPVTTVDFDCLFRKTAVSLKKLKSVAAAL